MRNGSHGEYGIVLEAMEMKAIVVNTQHIKAVPGRKTDVKDAERIPTMTDCVPQ